MTTNYTIPNFYDYDINECCYACMKYLNIDSLRQYIPQLDTVYRTNSCHDWRYIWYCVNEFMSSRDDHYNNPIYIAAIILHRMQPHYLAYAMDIPEETRWAILATDHINQYFTANNDTEALIHDISLSVLSAPRNLYCEYVRRDKADNKSKSHGYDPDYNRKRKKYIITLLKGRIYYSQRYDEEQARDNLRSELSSDYLS